MCILSVRRAVVNKSQTARANHYEETMYSIQCLCMCTLKALHVFSSKVIYVEEHGYKDCMDSYMSVYCLCEYVTEIEANRVLIVIVLITSCNCQS